MGARKKRPQKKRKLEIVFDENKRKEFLTGFRKRKNERKKRAKEDLEKLLKEEQKRIRQEVKDGVKYLKKSYEPIPEVETMLTEENLEDDEVTVKIVELSNSEMAKKQNWIGENRPANSESANDEENEEEVPVEEEQIPGMGLTIKNKTKKQKTLENGDKAKKTENNIKTKKDLDRIKQKQTLRSIKNSKLFKIKQNLDRLKAKQMSRQDKNKQLRELKKKHTKHGSKQRFTGMSNRGKRSAATSRGGKGGRRR